MADKKAKWQKEAEEAAIPAFEAVEGFREFISDPDPFIEDGGQPITLTVEELVGKKRTLDMVKKETEERLQWVGGQLMIAMAAAEVEKVKLQDGATLKIGYGRSADKIEPTKLLEQGVTVEQIKAATVEGKPYSYAQILQPKKGKG